MSAVKTPVSSSAVEDFILLTVKQASKPYFPRTLIPLVSDKYPGYAVRQAYWDLRASYKLLQEPTGELYVSSD